MPATRAGLGNVAPAWYGRYGGAETAEELKGELEEIERAYGDMRKGDKELDRAMREYVGRPTPLMRAANLSNGLGEGKEVLLKREDLCHTGAHCMTAALGQAWLASRMGKGRVVAATASGQHGAATAASCALLGLKCDLFIGLKDAKRQSANVIFSEARGAVVHTVGQGLADAVKAAAEAWKEDPSGTFPSSFSAVGPHPFPWLVRDLQSRVGEEARSQSLEQLGRLPDALVACIGGGSNSLGLFHPFLPEPDVRLVGAEAAGRQPRTELSLHGARTLGLDAPSSSSSFSVGAGLDYPAVGPELAHLIESERVEMMGANDDQALEWLKTVTAREGLMPSLEAAHAFAALDGLVGELSSGSAVVVSVSGHGDSKDLDLVRELDPSLA